MRDELEQYFENNHKELTSKVIFGFECADGWFDLTKDMCKELDEYIKSKNWPDEEPIITQLKEKFGALRCYMSQSDEGISAIIMKYEEISARTCESCGATGKMRNLQGWFKCLCDSCLSRG